MALTGTNGKTTTTSLTYEIVKSFNKKTLLEFVTCITSIKLIGQFIRMMGRHLLTDIQYFRKIFPLYGHLQQLQ
ncbi:MAG: hypothetical protein IIX35_00640 [Paraprevotella sp.]|nr:hypothetical protein [Paraprevotella sp.]